MVNTQAGGISAPTKAALEHEVARQIHRFAQLNDDHAHDALSDLFTIDGSFARPTDPDRPVVGREQIRAFFHNRPARRTKHFMTNVVVDLQGETMATARSYILLFAGDAGDIMLAGEFHDVLVREDDGVWRFRSRRGSLTFDAAK
ncbi:nuclear transport factor 2 family protein [Sphingomonas sp. CROZ-RG-20F-R02-07]|uniref:nuclear transport factor 2 family protein n=1 Tax=Sphingomonas sp. CROZ-RG-20F-R02-07 TaxID=2914832 RepID=UPI001F58B1E2|nr:nuclear transport factor 2 family protein [Sphingomonas sp. CROZ-RG-20F-R02-07]